MRTGEPALYTEIPDEMLVAAAVDEEHLGLLRAVGMRAVLIVPMTARGRTIGALTMVSAESGRTFDAGDVEFAGQIAERAALAVENARLYSDRSEIARTLQRSLLPEALPELPEWEVAAMYGPAGEGAEVGGDFYDFWEAEGDWLMMIGDMTGKGVRAAVIRASLLGALEEFQVGAQADDRALVVMRFCGRPDELRGPGPGGSRRRGAMRVNRGGNRATTCSASSTSRPAAQGDGRGPALALRR